MALGLLLKPYYLFVYVAIELFHVATYRKIDKKRAIVFCSVVVLGIVYSATTSIFHRPYIEHILPMLVYAYTSYRESTFIIIINYLLALYLFLFFAAFLPPTKIRLNARFYYWFVILLSMSALIFLQFKGWPYTYTPLHACMIYGLFLLLAEYRRREPQNHAPLHKSEKIYASCVIVSFTFLMIACLGNGYADSSNSSFISGLPLLSCFFLLHLGCEILQHDKKWRQEKAMEHLVYCAVLILAFFGLVGFVFTSNTNALPGYGMSIIAVGIVFTVLRRKMIRITSPTSVMPFFICCALVILFIIVYALRNVEHILQAFKTSIPKNWRTRSTKRNRPPFIFSVQVLNPYFLLLT